METQKVVPQKEFKPLVQKDQLTSFDEKKFFPSGAIAFFFALVALGLIIWFGIYFLMLERI